MTFRHLETRYILITEEHLPQSPSRLKRLRPLNLVGSIEVIPIVRIRSAVSQLGNCARITYKAVDTRLVILDTVSTKETS
jgi:hypothetical protein